MGSLADAGSRGGSLAFSPDRAAVSRTWNPAGAGVEPTPASEASREPVAPCVQRWRSGVEDRAGLAVVSKVEPFRPDST
jgi:hypothetical protein